MESDQLPDHGGWAVGLPRVFSGEAGTLGALGGALTFPGHTHPWALLLVAARQDGPPAEPYGSRGDAALGVCATGRGWAPRGAEEGCWASPYSDLRQRESTLANEQQSRDRPP